MWIVFEVEVGKRRLWAWAKPSPDPEIAGFDTVALSERDGMTFVDMPDTPVELGEVQFVVTHAPGVPA